MSSNNRFRKLFADADSAFDGAFPNELKGLLGLSEDEVNSISPGTTDLKTYSVLVKVVEDASKNNLSQAELANNIKSLGEVAVSIARKVPQLAILL